MSNYDRFLEECGDKDGFVPEQSKSRVARSADLLPLLALSISKSGFLTHSRYEGQPPSPEQIANLCKQVIMSFGSAMDALLKLQSDLFDVSFDQSLLEAMKGLEIALDRIDLQDASGMELLADPDFHQDLEFMQLLAVAVTREWDRREGNEV